MNEGLWENLATSLYHGLSLRGCWEMFHPLLSSSSFSSAPSFLERLLQRCHSHSLPHVHCHGDLSAFFSFSTKTLFILEPTFRIRQVSKYLNVWGRDTLHAFHLDRCLNYSRNKYRWWIERGGRRNTEGEANFRWLARPSGTAFYCCLLKVAPLPVL